jgi:hypothetical protein
MTTKTDQVMTALLAKGFERAERQQRFTVYVRHIDNTTVGLETFDDGDCLLWGLLPWGVLTFREQTREGGRRTLILH